MDKRSNEVIGTIELFHRDSEDYFHDCGLMRLDIKSDYERKECICEILLAITDAAYDLFD